MKCACGGRVGPECCEEGRGAKAKPRGSTERRGEGGQRNNGASKTPINLQPCLCSSLPFTLIPYFQKDQHESKQQRLHHCCYHFKAAIFHALTNLGTLIHDVYAWTLGVYFVKQNTPFHWSPSVYPCWFSTWRVIFCQICCSQWVQSPLAALPSAVP